MHAALDLGIRHFDTAPPYGLGSSESVTRSTALFVARDKKHRIFERLAIEGLSLPDVSGGELLSGCGW